MKNKKQKSIVSCDVKSFIYSQPLIVIDENGEAQTHHSKSNVLSTYIKRIVLLNEVENDSFGKVISYEPLHYVNRFLMSHHIENEKQESAQYSKGLIHFFSFLFELQNIWDCEYGNGTYDESMDLPRPSWNYMPVRKSQRITYLYREALKKSVYSDAVPSSKLARTTATAYMNAVIAFYRYHMRNNYNFNNPPFENKTIRINFRASETNMNEFQSKNVNTTDLKLSFRKSSRNIAGVLPSSRRDLRPFTNIEWKAAENILLNTRVVDKNVNGNTKQTALALEYCLFFLISRYTGLRKIEVASLHSEQITKPIFRRLILKLGVGDEYGSITKTVGFGNKSRETIIPGYIMEMIYDYTLTPRYLKRLQNFKDRYKNQVHINADIDITKNYIFISSTGIPFFEKLNELNNRWSEIRNTMSRILEQEVTGTIHNLRATFAVAIFRALLRKRTVDVALAVVSNLLGHEDIKTTLLYLKIAEDEPTGDEIYEDILEYIGMFDELNMPDDKNKYV
jgi:integrase